MMTLKPSKIKAVDFDGTVAIHISKDSRNFEYDPERVGEPINLMVKRVKMWLAEGKEVVIFTARVHPYHGVEDNEKAKKAIEKFCIEHFGRVLEVTCMKSPEFEEIWDDRVVRVERNTGLVSTQSDIPDPLMQSDCIGNFFCDK